MGRTKCDHIKRLITLTSDNIKRLSPKTCLKCYRFHSMKFLCNFQANIRVIDLEVP